MSIISRNVVILFSTFIFAAMGVKAQSEGGFVTLYAFDPVGNSLCLTDGQGGSLIKGNIKYNRCSHLNFHSYNADQFTVGIQGGDEGSIIDLGDDKHLKASFGVPGTVGGGDGYASLHLRNRKVHMLKDYSQRTFQEIPGADRLFSEDRKFKSAEIKLGHTYLLRIWQTHRRSEDPDDEILAKLIVVAFCPGESVTFRWELMNDTKEVGERSTAIK